MVPVKMTALLFTLASLCLCDDTQPETHRILNQGPVYTRNNRVLPNQGQDFKSSNVYENNNNNKYEDLYKSYYTGKHVNGNEHNIAQNNQVNYGQHGNGQILNYGGQYGQLYGKNYGSYLNYNTGLIDGLVNTKPVSAQIPIENYYGYNYGETQISDSLAGFKNIATKTLPLQSPTGIQYEYNYGQAHQTNDVLNGSGKTENIRTLPIQVPGQDFHEYSYEEALKSSGVLDASGNNVANSKTVATQVPTGNQYGYNYEELLNTNVVLGGSGNIKAYPIQAQTGNYYGYNFGHNLKDTAGLNGYLYNIDNDVFNKQVRTQVPQQNDYTTRKGKQINVDSGMYNAGYGYDYENTDSVSKPVATEADRANANKYIGLYQIGQNVVANEIVSRSAPANFKPKLATAVVYHTNAENQKYSTSGINNAVQPGNSKFSNYPVPTSVPVLVSKPQNYEVEFIQSSKPDLNEPTQSVLEYNSHQYSVSNTHPTASQTLQNYNIVSTKPNQVNIHYTASEDQSTLEHDANEYINSALQSSPIGKQQTNIPSAYVKERKAVDGLKQQIKGYQVPEIVSIGPYHSSVHPVKVTINSHNISGYNNPGTNYETKKLLEQYGVNNNRAPVTFYNNAYKSDGYFYDGSDLQIYQNKNLHSEYGKESSQHDHDVVKHSSLSPTAFNPSEYVSTDSISNDDKSQYGAYDTINLNSFQNAAKGNQFNEHNANDDNFNFNESYDNQHEPEASEQLTAGFETDSYKTNVYNQQPNSYLSNNYVSSGYVIGDVGHAANNIQTGEYEPTTYKTITNVSNRYDLGYNSNSAGYESRYETDGYSSDAYNANGFKPIKLTTSTYENSNQDTSGYKLNAQESQDFAAYNQIIQSQKTSGQGDYNSNQLKPFSYRTSQAEKEKILRKENRTGQFDAVYSKVNDQNSEENNLKSTGKNHKSKKGKSGSSSAFVSVKHGDHSYSYNVKQHTK